ncbi:MAG TPA: hypothetical protein DD435_02285 [Cyanobacteria bacterium UBA8530]|nr:hypothetical protein [Cyanobacteria bacterium UBA8530]
MATEKSKSFSEYIYNARQGRGWSLRDAAGHVGIAHSRLDEIEKGIDGHSGKPFLPSYMTVVKIAKAYGLPPDETLEKAGYQPGIELTAEEWILIKVFRSLSRDQHSHLFEVLALLQRANEPPR